MTGATANLPAENWDCSTPLEQLPSNADLDAWLEAQEALVPNLREDARRRVTWRQAPGEKTDLAVVYLHGFSASAHEVSPLCEQLAESLGANLYMDRMAGHGRDGPAMADGTVDAWLAGGQQALAIGERIGGRIILIATSQGGALATHLLCSGVTVAAAVLIAPNYGPRAWSARLLRWPLARRWVPWVIGNVRRLDPVNELQQRIWTNEYPVSALFPMMDMAVAARRLPVEELSTPVLMVYSPDDEVVSANYIDGVFSRWGSEAKRRVLFRDSESPGQHVIAGDACSPGATAAVRQHIEQFLVETSDVGATTTS